MMTTRSWKDFEGVSLDGRYWLKQCLSETPDGAWYLTRAAEDAVVRVLSADAPFAENALAMWREAGRFDHPHIVRMLDAGRAEVDGAVLVYAVCESPDAYLSGVLDDRPLAPEEARDVLRAVLSALAFLHGRGLAHGAVDPTQIMAFGDRVKLPSYTIRRAGNPAPPGDPGPYDAPEVAAGGPATPASDIWSLGVTLLQSLTRELPGSAAADSLPEPFRSIVTHTLQHDPQLRWTVADIARRLDPPAPAPEPMPVPEAPRPEPVAAAPLPDAPLPDAPAPVPAPRPAPPLNRGFPIRWIPAAGLVAAVALSAVVFRSPNRQPPAPPPPPAQATAPKLAPVAAPRPAPIPPPAEAAVPSTQSQIWRVVPYTYATRAAAEKMVRKLNDQRSAWHAEVFAPKGDRYPFYVSLGGRITLAQAQRLQKEARAHGLPRDTFVRNFAN